MTFVKYVINDYQNTSSYSGLNFSVIGGTTWSLTPWEVTTAYDLRLSRKLGNLNDTWDFKIDNIGNRNKDTFRLQDKMVFSLSLNSSSVSGSQVFSGMVKAIEERCDEKGPFLNIKGVSFDEFVTNGLCYVDETDVTVFQFLERATLSLQNRTKPNDSTGQFYLKWNSGNPSTQAYNSITGNYDGVALPKFLGGGKVSYYNKTLDQLLNTFLNEQYTGDGRYYWYVNVDQELVIRKMLFNSVATIIEGTTDMISYQLTVDTTQIYNLVIVQAGSDPNGRAISTYADDSMLIAQYGVRPFLLKTNDSNILSEQERKVNSSYWSTTSQYPITYPYTCGWKDENDAVVTATNDADFLNKFRTEVKRRGKNNALFFISSHSKGMRQFTIELPPQLTYRLGDIISCTFPSYNISNFPIRVYQIDYSYDNVVLTLKEEYLYAI
jgi:hypothetical protein